MCKQQELRGSLCDARQVTFLLCCLDFWMCQRGQVELVIADFPGNWKAWGYFMAEVGFLRLLEG